MAKKEVWEVEIGSLKHEGELHQEYRIFAHSAAEAEAKGLALAEKGGLIKQPYCRRAEFLFYVGA
jgi:hypothetical protein